MKKWVIFYNKTQRKQFLQLAFLSQTINLFCFAISTKYDFLFNKGY